MDVKATDQLGRAFQVDVQVRRTPALPERILFTLAGIYREQLDAGDDYTKLRGAASIWICGCRLFKDAHYHHRFRFQDERTGSWLPDGGPRPRAAQVAAPARAP